MFLFVLSPKNAQGSLKKKNFRPAWILKMSLYSKLAKLKIIFLKGYIQINILDHNIFLS